VEDREVERAAEGADNEASKDVLDRHDDAESRAKALIGTTLSGRYRIDALLAMGGMGAVYRGEHVHMHKRVAIKVLHPMTEGSPELVLRFRREAIAGAHITHVNVAGATDFGDLEDGSHFLIMEYVEGTTLHERMSHGPVDEDTATNIARQIGLGLAAAHDKGIVHRDLKPRNVMLASGGGRDTVKLIDFGLAKVEIDKLDTNVDPRKSQPERITADGVIFGTMAYIAPECAFGMDTIDGRADLYALGVILYEMISGRHLFDGTQPGELFAAHRNRKPKPIAERAPGVVASPFIESVIMRLLEKDPAERFATSADLVAALDDARAMSGLESLAIVTSVRPPSIVAISAAASTPSDLTPPPPPRLPSFDLPSEHDASPAKSAEQARLPPPRTPPKRSDPPRLSSAPQVQKLALGGVIAVLAIALVVSIVTRPRSTVTPAASASVTAITATAVVPVPLPSASAATSAVTAPSAAPTETTIDLDDATNDAPEAANALAGLDVPALARMLRRSAASKHWTRGEQALLALIDRDATAGLADETTRGAARDVASALDSMGEKHGDRAFEALEKRAGSYGVDVLYDIVQSRGLSKPALRATKSLARPDVAAHASPALRIALELRKAPCDKKLELLDRAVEEGDVRALTVLETLGSACFKKPNKKLQIAVRRLKDKLGKP
jgi:serine/threonine-protein kinase